MGEHTVERRPFAVEWIRVGAGGRAGAAGIL